MDRFRSQALGYESSNILKADIRALRDVYDLEIETAGRGPGHMPLVLRAPMTKGEYFLVGLLFATIAGAFYVMLYL